MVDNFNFEIEWVERFGLGFFSPTSKHIGWSDITSSLLRMYTAFIVIALLFPVWTVQAAPSQMYKPLRHILPKPKPNPLVAELVEIDSTCSSDREKLILVEQALSDAYDIAKVGEGIKPEDAA